MTEEENAIEKYYENLYWTVVQDGYDGTFQQFWKDTEEERTRAQEAVDELRETK